MFVSGPVKEGEKECSSTATIKLTVQVVNSGATKNTFLQACLREVYHICVLNSLEIKVLWLKTTENTVADLLSRWDQHPRYSKKFFEMTAGCILEEVPVNEEDLKFQYTSI